MLVLTVNTVKYWSGVKWSVVGWSALKWSEVLSTRVSTFIRRHIIWGLLLIWFFLLSHSFIFFWSHFLSLYICMIVCFVCFCLILQIMYFYCYIYVFLLLYLCIFIVIYVLFCVFCFIVLFWVLLVCKSVLYYCHRVSTQLKFKKYIKNQLCTTIGSI